MKKYYYFLFLASLLSACAEFFEKGPENIIMTGTPIEIGLDNAQIKGGLLDLREDVDDSLIAVGHRWAIDDPALLANPIPSDSGTFPLPTDREGITNFAEFQSKGDFISFLSDLTPKTTYFVRAYVLNESGIIYGDLVRIIPGTLKMLSVFNISATNAQAEGAIDAGFIDEFTTVGHVWSMEQNPPILNSNNVNKTEFNVSNISESIFESNLTGLSPNNTYFIRPYAIDNQGFTHYGETFVFITNQN